MTPELRIDNNLDKILKAAGSSLSNYTMNGSKERLRNAMREVMMDSYIYGCNDCRKIQTGEHSSSNKSLQY